MCVILGFIIVVKSLVFFPPRSQLDKRSEQRRQPACVDCMLEISVQSKHSRQSDCDAQQFSRLLVPQQEV